MERIQIFNIYFVQTWGGLEPDSPTLSFSPPTNPMRAMRLFDGLSSPNTACALTSPRSTPRAYFMKSRLLFEEDGEHRRASLPNPQVFQSPGPPPHQFILPCFYIVKKNNWFFRFYFYLTFWTLNKHFSIVWETKIFSFKTLL